MTDPKDRLLQSGDGSEVRRIGFAGTTVERAVLCASGRVHYAHEYLDHDDPERVREVADKQASEAWCGGAPHVVKQRERIITGWHEVTT